ncbi:site-specific integrase [Umezawaea sp. Da 62-37]|uniref:tyrosine-type recombinase/integrase n=1 Tax=Umezawaea sp. Da 62-37 TaxID=3075927 RepID=UPI0028F737AB|nr:site-specific integrase [Umezawaea sp. Da 62-37]WNV84866.1 site-specific integrase [Umezawaea sp. Da 62-37]
MSTNPATVTAARHLLDQLGLTTEDLRWVPGDIPTVADYLPEVIAAAAPGARNTYGIYWTYILAAFGDRRLDQVTPTDIEALMRHHIAIRRVRSNDRGGHSTAEHLLAAMRTLYVHAVNDELLPPHHNPAARVRKPRRRPSTRHALTAPELAAVNEAVAASGNDTPLDTLLIRLHTETACRRGGALALREDDIDPRWCLLRLREKNDTTRWQPASPTLITALLHHRDHRGTGHPSTQRLLRRHDGAPITSRRYDYIWGRVRTDLPWAATRGISTHWLRHTTLTWVERHFGHAIAHAYAGHTDHHDDTTSLYTRAQLPELAAALAAYTGEPHPLANARPTNRPAIYDPSTEPAPSTAQQREPRPVPTTNSDSSSITTLA